MQADPEDQTAADLVVVLLETATLRSDYQQGYGERIERMLRLSKNVDVNEQVNIILSISFSSELKRSIPSLLEILQSLCSGL